jgi:hypothetical protein
LQSLGLPGLNGKGKQRKIEILVKYNVDGKQWNIIFPEKVSCFIFLLNCYFAINIFLQLQYGLMPDFFLPILLVVFIWFDQKKYSSKKL